MVEYRLTQTGEEVQEILDQVTPNEVAIAKEIEDRTDADTAIRTDLGADIAAETQRAQGAEQELHNYVDAETQRAQGAEQAEAERAQGVEANLQQQINNIVAGDATVNLAASPSAIFAEVESTINLTATTNKNASAIVIKKGAEELPLDTSTPTLATASDTVTPAEVGTIAYSAWFTISGVERTASRSVSVVLPIYYGVGVEYPAEMTKDNTPRVPGSFNYSNIETEAGDFLYFEIPDDKKLTALAVVSAPADTSLSFEQIESQREGYKAYRNVEPRGTGTYTYKLTIAND